MLIYNLFLFLCHWLHYFLRGDSALYAGREYLCVAGFGAIFQQSDCSWRDGCDLSGVGGLRLVVSESIRQRDQGTVSLSVWRCLRGHRFFAVGAVMIFYNASRSCKEKQIYTLYRV